MKAVAVIPARFASTRFPGKALASDSGKYLIQHVYEQVLRAQRIDLVLLATDDNRIVEAVHSFGGQAVMTRADHCSGTDRVAEAIQDFEGDIVVNVQGDEPEIDPAHIDRLVALLTERPDCSIATLACPFEYVPDSDPTDPAAVKVVVNQNGSALYFSRSLIPFPRRSDSAGRPLLHLGIYAYRREFLFQLAKLSPTPCEQAESLEQLRVLEHGHDIAVGIVDSASCGIDTPEDYRAFLIRYKNQTMASANSNKRESGEHNHAR